MFHDTPRYFFPVGRCAVVAFGVLSPCLLEGCGYSDGVFWLWCGWWWLERQAKTETRGRAFITVIIIIIIITVFTVILVMAFGTIIEVAIGTIIEEKQERWRRR